MRELIITSCEVCPFTNIGNDVYDRYDKYDTCKLEDNIRYPGMEFMYIQPEKYSFPTDCPLKKESVMIKIKER